MSFFTEALYHPKTDTNPNAKMKPYQKIKNHCQDISKAFRDKHRHSPAKLRDLLSFIRDHRGPIQDLYSEFVAMPKKHSVVKFSEFLMNLFNRMMGYTVLDMTLHEKWCYEDDIDPNAQLTDIFFKGTEEAIFLSMTTSLSGRLLNR